MRVTHGAVDEGERRLGDSDVGRPQFIVDDRLLVDFAFFDGVQHNDVTYHRRLHTRTRWHVKHNSLLLTTIPTTLQRSQYLT